MSPNENIINKIYGLRSDMEKYEGWNKKGISHWYTIMTMYKKEIRG